MRRSFWGLLPSVRKIFVKKYFAADFAYHQAGFRRNLLKLLAGKISRSARVFFTKSIKTLFVFLHYI
jgi:hypothetical protein